MFRRPIPRPITVVYRRLPHDIREFHSILVQATPNRLVVQSPIKTRRPLRVSDKVIADNGYLALWFVYRNKWYDVGKFYDKAKNWIGYYCDIVKPTARLFSGASRTATLTDLFLDLWITPGGEHFILDEEELNLALKRRDISQSLARQARKQMAALVRRVNAGRFPPVLVRRARLLEEY